MRKFLRPAIFPVASLLVAGCTAAPSETTDAPALVPPMLQSAAPTATQPRVIAAPAPLLARAIAIPSTRLPSPNGYDLLARAANSIQREGAGSPLTMERLSPEEDLKRQRASTLKNAAALSLLRQGLKLPLVVPPKRGLSAPSPPYSALRWLARMVLQESAVRAADKRWDLAVDGALDVVQMGAVLQNGSNTLGMLVGSAIESMGRGDVARWRGQLNAAQAGQAARRLESIEARRSGYEAISREAMWNSLSELRDVFKNADWKKSRAGSDPKGYAALFRDPRDIARLRQTSDRQIEANFVATMQAANARDRLPYSPKLPLVPDPADPLSTLFVGAETSRGVTRSRVNYERNSASNRLLTVDLALQAFVTPRANYPQSLGELVPKYLATVPRDPFAPKSELRYKRRGDRFLLYSVGPDGVDNGGAPMKTRGISLDSVGDMLSGSFK